MNRRYRLASMGLVVALAVGCGIKQEGLSAELAALASDSNEASVANDQATTLLSSPLQSLGDPSTIGSPEAAAGASQTPPTYFQPAGCLTVAKQTTSVTYTFANCTGPYGLIGVDGAITASFSVAKIGELDVAVTSQGLTIAKTPVTLTAQGTITFVGTKRLLSWSGSYQGVTASGRTLTHHGAYDGSYDQASGCLELDGSASTTLGAAGVDSVTAGYRRCNACPEAGTITATGKLSKLSLSVRYLGGGKAELKGPGGRIYPYSLFWCQ